MECQNLEKNLSFCGCTYDPCSRKGRCCECIRYHVTKRELPACAFPPGAEKTYDRSFEKFIESTR
ncbi:MAG: DUF6485 family protein [Actinobacteria bacterium]|nr:DUF6485 family protein [Actinomycetota bacterium]